MPADAAPAAAAGAPAPDLRAAPWWQGAPLSLAAGAVVFREGDPPDRLYLLLSGRVALSRGRRVIATLGPGQLLGVPSMVDERPRSATATMREPGELRALDAARFRTLAEETPDFVRAVMAELAQRLRAINDSL